MFAQIRHLASHTERYDTMAKFYQTIFVLPNDFWHEANHHWSDG